MSKYLHITPLTTDYVVSGLIDNYELVDNAIDHRNTDVIVHHNNYKISDFAEADFVHGDFSDLILGKVCVVRNRVFHIVHNRYGWEIVKDNVCIHLNKGVILVIGYTNNRNAKIVYKL